MIFAEINGWANIASPHPVSFIIGPTTERIGKQIILCFALDFQRYMSVNVDRKSGMFLKRLDH